MPQNTYTKKNIIHISFEITLLLKAVYGIMEILGGIFLIFLNPDRLNSLTHFLTRHELSENPTDIVANYLLSFSSSFSISTQHFAVFYLISHGVIKCLLIFLLWKKKLFAYPLTIASLILFIAYQMYRFTFTHSIFLIFLTVFDIIMIILTYLEYQNIHSSSKSHKNTF